MKSAWPLYALLLCICVPAQSFAQKNQLERPPNAIPIFYTEISPNRYATQLNFSVGTGRITRSDKPLHSVSGEIKGIHNLTGAIYLSTGVGFSYLHSQSRPADASPPTNRSAWLAYLPSGIGFTMGDDYASIITGVDVLTGIYLHEEPKLEHQRRFAYGFGPEFGYLFRVGPRYSKGVLLGMVGKLQFMQLPDLNDGPGLRYTYGGIGLVVRFY